MSRKKSKLKSNEQEKIVRTNLLAVYYFGNSTKYRFTSSITGNTYIWEKSGLNLAPMVLVDELDIDKIMQIKGRAENPNKERKQYLFGE